MRRAFLLLVSLAGCNTDTRGAGPGSAAPAATGELEVVAVVSKPLDAVTHLEGELTPFEAVALYPRATGFVSRVLVDRGSIVKANQLLIAIVAPELASQRAEAEAKLEADRSTFERLTAAAQTPGAVAGHEVELAKGTLQADQARVQTLREGESYLAVTAPFDGVITERNVHPGALVGPQTAPAMLRLERVAQLRLTVAVPELLVGGIAEGAATTFSVRAWPGETFTGTIRRVSHTVEVKTRSMPVELDVDNAAGRLAPGMFADVVWPVRRPTPSLFVPPGAIVQSTTQTFVARVRDGVVDQVPVRRGATMGELVEVFGALQAGDLVARRGSEELRDGTQVKAHESPAGGSGR